MNRNRLREARHSVIVGVVCALTVIASTLVAPAVCRATWSADPSICLALGDTTTTQVHPFVVSDGHGGFFSAWWDYWARLQYVSETGSVGNGWPSQGLTMQPASASDETRLVASDRGRVLACVYDSDSSGFRIHKFSQLGERLWGQTANHVEWAHFGVECAMVAMPDGGAIVAWMEPHAPATTFDNLWAMRIDSLGTRAWTQDLPLCNAPGPQRYLRGTLSSDTTVIFMWSDSRRDSLSPYTMWDTYAQKLSTSGIEMWGHNGRRVRTGPARGLGIDVSLGDGIVSDGHGGAFAILVDDTLDAHGDVTLVRVDSTGSMASIWPDGGLQIDWSSWWAFAFPAISVDPAGNAAVCWVATDPDWGTTALKCQKVTLDGQKLWGVDGLALTMPWDHRSFAVTGDGEGGLFYLNSIANGGNPTDAYVQHLSSGGVPRWSGNGVLAVRRKTTIYPVMRPDSSGGVFVCWEDDPMTQSRILAQHVNADGTLGGDVVDALLSLASADATPDGARLRWYTSERSITGADLERNVDETGWAPLARVTPDGTGTLAYDDRDVTPGHRYGYRLLVQIGGATTPMGEAWVTIPATATFALRGVQPNPSEGELTVALTLPDAAPARLEVFDVSGRRVASRDVGTLGAGMHLVRFARPDAPLRPGVYAVRLTRADRTLSVRAVVVR